MKEVLARPSPDSDEGTTNNGADDLPHLIGLASDMVTNTSGRQRTVSVIGFLIGVVLLTAAAGIAVPPSTPVDPMLRLQFQGLDRVAPSSRALYG